MNGRQWSRKCDKEGVKIFFTSWKWLARSCEERRCLIVSLEHDCLFFHWFCSFGRLFWPLESKILRLLDRYYKFEEAEKIQNQKKIFFLFATPLPTDLCYFPTNFIQKHTKKKLVYDMVDGENEQFSWVENWRNNNNDWFSRKK